MPMIECRCKSGSMWDVLDYFGMDLTRIPHSCEIFKIYPTAITTVIGLVGGILFSLGAIDRRYLDVSLLSDIPESLFLFSIFCDGGL